MTELEKRVEWLELQMRLVHRTLDKIDRKDEPQTERTCTNCKHNGVLSVPKCDECHGMDKHEFIEPQTECETCKHNKLEWFSEKCDECSKAHSNYEPQTEQNAITT